MTVGVWIITLRFQSTHPHGVRQQNRMFIKYQYYVSIHAPTRGATLLFSNQDFQNLFQSTHPHGVRPGLNCIAHFIRQFQSTHPHGVRLFPTPYKGTTYFCFNPRTHTGCDPGCFVRVRLPIVVSIHAPTRGATLKKSNAPYSHGRFQSTHPHGVRRRVQNTTFRFPLFQSTHPHGVRRD